MPRDIFEGFVNIQSFGCGLHFTIILQALSHVSLFCPI